MEQLRANGVDARLGDIADAKAIIFLGGLSQFDDEDGALAMLTQAFDAAKHIATGDGNLLVTVQDTGGDFGLRGAEQPFVGALAGLAKTADLEWSDAAVKAIDVERGNRAPEAVAAAVVAELLAGGPEIEVGLRANGQRIVLESHPVALPQTDAPPLADGTVVVCTGGARGVTAATLIGLAERSRNLCFALLFGDRVSHRPRPNPHPGPHAPLFFYDRETKEMYSIYLQVDFPISNWWKLCSGCRCRPSRRSGRLIQQLHSSRH